MASLKTHTATLGYGTITHCKPRASCDDDEREEGWRLAVMEGMEESKGKDHTKQQSWLYAHALPDCGYEIAPLHLVRFLKLLVASLLLFGLTRNVVIGLDLEYDSDYGMDDFLTYDVNEVVLDLLFLYAASGMYARPAVDQPVFVGFAACNAFVISITNQIPAMQVSFSLFEMHCHWSRWTWFFLSCFGSIAAVVLVVHLRFLSAHPKIAKRAGLQLLITFVIFWVPHLRDGDFHIHHWFWSWFLASQCTFDPWWSRATQAWLLGGYINGIAVYGRDPILVCEDAYYRSRNAQCAFVKHLDHCHLPGQNLTVRITADVADWWTCTGDYH
jgi:hypothetical protein